MGAGKATKRNFNQLLKMQNSGTHKLLESLLNELERHNAPVLRYLKDGVSKEKIEAAFEENNIPLKLPEEVLELYKWKNGVSAFIEDDEPIIGELELFTQGVYTSFQLSFDTYISHILKSDFFTPSMFPLFESGSGELFLVECNPGSPEYKKILMFTLHDPILAGGEVKSKYDSMESLLLTVLECYQKGIYFFSEFEGKRVFDIERMSEVEVATKHNPTSDYWAALQNQH